MKNISLPQVVYCKTHSVAYRKINCKHWEFNAEGDCSPFCSLKNKNVTNKDCTECTVREQLEDVDAKIKTFAQQLREKTPQYNYYSAKKMIEESQNNKTFIENAAQYTKTETSQLIEGKVSEEVFEKRKSICMECPRRKNPTPETESIGWCASCGCSAKNPRAALSNKLWMPSLICPLNKFPQEKGQGFNFGDAVDSVKGAIQSVASLFKQDGNT